MTLTERSLIQLKKVIKEILVFRINNAITIEVEVD